MEMDDPEQRRVFRKNLSKLGIAEVRYRLDSGKYSKKKSVVVQQWIADHDSGGLLQDDLVDAIDELEALKPLFVKEGSTWGYFLDTGNSAKFERSYLEVKTIIDKLLGEKSNYSQKLDTIYSEGVGGFMGGPSFACVEELIEVCSGALKQIRRKQSGLGRDLEKHQNPEFYVDLSRIKELQNSPKENWDTSRLLQMCIELNSAYASERYISVAMLIRGIIDHVPPIFGKKNFRKLPTIVAQNHSMNPCANWTTRCEKLAIFTCTRKSGKWKACLQGSKWMFVVK